MKIPLIILTRNLSWMTINLFESIKNTSNVNKYEFVLVDNGSRQEESDKMHGWLDDNVSNYKILWDEEPLGFVKAANRGFQYVLDEGKPYFFLFNNDTMVTTGWDEKLLESVREPDVAMAGPVSSPPNWRETPMGKAVIKGKLRYSQVSETLENFSKNLRDNFDDVKQEVDFLAFYCVAGDSKILENVGVLDERFNEGLFDDDDYCHRLLMAGYKLILRRDIYVHHNHRSTWIEHDYKYKEMLEENRKIFIDKWGFDPWDRVKEGRKK